MLHAFALGPQLPKKWDDLKDWKIRDLQDGAKNLEESIETRLDEEYEKGADKAHTERIKEEVYALKLILQKLRSLTQ